MRALDPKKCSVWKRMQFEALDAMQSHLEGSLLRLALASRLSIKHIHLVGGDWNIWIIFPYIGNFIIPTDFHIFQRGWNHQPDIVEPEIGTQKSFRPQDSCNVDSDSESFWIIDVLFPLVGWLIEGIRGVCLPKGHYCSESPVHDFGTPRFLPVFWRFNGSNLMVISDAGLGGAVPARNGHRGLHGGFSQQLDGFDWPIIMLRLRGIIPKWNYLRLVNYYHLPRIMIRKWTDGESVESLRFFSHGFIFLTCPFDGLGEFVKLKPIWLKQIGWNSDVILNEWQLWQDSHIFNIWRIFVFFPVFGNLKPTLLYFFHKKSRISMCSSWKSTSYDVGDGGFQETMVSCRSSLKPVHFG